jgi:hypothetical protein
VAHAAAKPTYEALANLLRSLASEGPGSLEKDELTALQTRRPSETRDALWQLERSQRPVSLSPSITIPEGTHPVDWLLSQKPEYADLPVARWDGRHMSEVLTKLAHLHAFSPDYCNDPVASGYDPGDPGLTDYILKGAQWGLSAELEPILSLQDVDRRGSMLGAFPWTCEAYPWPNGVDGPMSPLVQLNLRDLDLSLIADFPDVLLQAWGHGYREYLRLIPLSEIDQRSPFPDYVQSKNEHYFETVGTNPDELGCLGMTVSAVAADFQVVGGNAANCLRDRSLSAPYWEVIDEETQGAIATLARALREAADRETEGRGDPQGFGGWGSSPQAGYNYWTDGLCLFKYYSDADGDGPGLYCGYMGELTIQFDPTDLQDGYTVEISQFR